MTLLGNDELQKKRYGLFVLALLLLAAGGVGLFLGLHNPMIRSLGSYGGHDQCIPRPCLSCSQSASLGCRKWARGRFHSGQWARTSTLDRLGIFGADCGRCVVLTPP